MSILFKLTSRYRQNPKVVSARIHVYVCVGVSVWVRVCVLHMLTMDGNLELGVR